MKSLMIAFAALAVSFSAAALIPESSSAAVVGKLGDLSTFETIANDTLVIAQSGDLVAAQKRITDFETAWDEAEPKLYPLDHTEWGKIDEAADSAISALRTSKPDAGEAKTTLVDLIAALNGSAQ